MTMNLQFVNETEAVINDSLGNGDYHGDFKFEGSGSDSDPDGPPSKRMDLGSGSGQRCGKKTKGRVKIKMEFIENKLRRYTTFSKRKTGIMKKAYELSTLTGTQVMLLVASETGHVYTFATKKLQPMITSESGKALIQTCLNSPDGMGVTLSPQNQSSDQRMNPTGFEEPELSYGISEDEPEGSSPEKSEEATKTNLSYLGNVVQQQLSSTVTVTSNTSSVSGPIPNTQQNTGVTAIPTLLPSSTNVQPPPAHMGIQSTPTISQQPPHAHMGPGVMTTTTATIPTQRTLAMAAPLSSVPQPQAGTTANTVKPTLSMQLPNGGLTFLQPSNVAPGTPIAIASLQQSHLQASQSQQQHQQQQQQQQIVTQQQQQHTAPQQQAVYRIQTPSGQVITLPGIGQISSSTPNDNTNNVSTMSAPTQLQSQAQMPQPIAVVTGSNTTSASPMMYQTPQGIMYATTSPNTVGTLPEGYIINLPQTPAINVAPDQQNGTTPQQYITIPVPVSLATGAPQMLQPILAQATADATRMEKPHK